MATKTQLHLFNNDVTSRVFEAVAVSLPSYGRDFTLNITVADVDKPKGIRIHINTFTPIGRAVAPLLLESLKKELTRE